jgi:amino acid transporter
MCQVKVADNPKIFIGDYGNAAIAIIVQACPYMMQLALVWLLTASLFVSGIPVITTSARITYALVRDQIIPGQDHLTQLDPNTQQPIYCILIVYIAVCLLLLLPLVNESAFYSFCSICAFGANVSYAIPICLKLFGSSRSTFPYGPVNFGGYTIYLEVVSVIFLLYQAVILLFPYSYPVTADNMNYSVVIIGGIVILMHIAWECANKRTFKGPLRHAVYRSIDNIPNGSTSSSHQQDLTETRTGTEDATETDRLLLGSEGRATGRKDR